MLAASCVKGLVTINHTKIISQNSPDALQSLSGDLANVLDAEKIMEGKNSRHLRGI